jgi:RNA-splicing ligase RtcB
MSDDNVFVAEVKRGAGRPQKDKFSDVPQEFKDEAHRSSKAEIDMMFSKIAQDEAANRLAQSLDEHLAECREAAKLANADYAASTKMNRLKADYLAAFNEE